MRQLSGSRLRKSQPSLPELAAFVNRGDIRDPEWAETARSIENSRHERRPGQVQSWIM